MGQRDDTESVCRDVVEAVAARMGVDPLDLDRPLGDVVDPDSLGRLFRDGGRDRPTGRVEFRYCGYDVTVSSDGRVEVDE